MVSLPSPTILMHSSAKLKLEIISGKHIGKQGKEAAQPLSSLQPWSDSFNSELNPCLIQSSQVKYFFDLQRGKYVIFSDSLCQRNILSGDEVPHVRRPPLPIVAFSIFLLWPTFLTLFLLSVPTWKKLLQQICYIDILVVNPWQTVVLKFFYAVH